LASNSYHYGNFDLLWIQIHGDRHSNAPTQSEDGIRLSTYPSLWCHVFARHPFNLGPEQDDHVDDLVWIRQDNLQGLSLFVGINYPIFHQQPANDVAQAGPSAGQVISLLQRDCVFAAYHQARPYYRPVPDWSRIHVNGGAPAIGSQLIYQDSYYNEWKAPMWIIPTLPRAPPSLGRRLGTARKLVTLKCPTFKLKLTNTGMMMCKASVIDYLLVTDIFCCVMITCMTKKWNDVQLFGFAKLTYFVVL
jgi:hypothetical protein